MLLCCFIVGVAWLCLLCVDWCCFCVAVVVFVVYVVVLFGVALRDLFDASVALLC